MSIDMDKVRRESVRWTLMLALNHSRPTSLREEVLLSTVQGIFADSTKIEIRRELEYLKARRLALVTKQPDSRWLAELTRYGVDIAEYTVDCEPGIARPEKYW